MTSGMGLGERGEHMQRRRQCLPICAAIGSILFAGASPGSVVAADRTVAVALFYAPTPVNTYNGIAPEEYASADMSARLAASSAGRFAVVARERVRAQESGLRWQEWDALRYARLGELAHAAGADTIVVGWIQSLVLDRFGGGGHNFSMGGGEGGGVLSAVTVVVAQVFDASQGRIVHQTKVDGHALGAVPMIVVQGALDDAVRRAVAQLAGPLTALSIAP